MAAYKDQLDRTRRYLDRMNHHDRSDDDYGDDVWSFFQNCWHLKDWIKNDSALSMQQRSIIETKVSTAQNLQICADLANARKHLFLRQPRVGARHSHKNFVLTPGEASKIEYVIETGSGTKVNSLQLAHACLAEWEQILQDLGLPT